MVDEVEGPGAFPIVALVCSAGGLAAPIDVVDRLPAGFPAPVIALQHHSADHASFLASILGEHSRLPVQLMADGQRLAPATVIVVPPGVTPWSPPNWKWS